MSAEVSLSPETTSASQTTTIGSTWPWGGRGWYESANPPQAQAVKDDNTVILVSSSDRRVADVIKKKSSD